MGKNITSLTIIFRQAKAVTLANLKARYRKTWAGFLWVVLSPMITFSVQALVFGQFLKIQMDHYLLFLVSGLIPWIFIFQTLEMSAPILVNSAHLVKSFPASPIVYLAAQFMDNWINFVASYALAFFPVLIYEGAFHIYLLILPLPVLVLAIGVFSMAWLLAVAQVFFRDTRFLLTFIMQIAFFLTPIFYPRENVPAHLQWLIALNPFYHLIAPFQILLYHFEPRPFALAMGEASLTGLILFTLAAWLWSSRKNMVYFYV